MKKFFLFLFVVLTVFALVACKEAPASQEPDPTPEPSPEPQPEPEPEPEPADPIVESGVLFVRPAEGCNWGTQTGKFQFKLDVSFEAGKSIALHAKFSDDVTSVAVRQGGGDNTKFKVNGLEAITLDQFQQDEDGWYIVEIPAESVTPMDSATPVDSWIGLGITVYLPDDKKNGCFVALKGLSFDGEFFDITEWDEEDCAQPYYNVPDKLDIVLTLDEESK